MAHGRSTAHLRRSSTAQRPTGEAVETRQASGVAKFDETVEVLDEAQHQEQTHHPRRQWLFPTFSQGQADSRLCQGRPRLRKARKAGAAFVGDTDLIDKIKGGLAWISTSGGNPGMEGLRQAWPEFLGRPRASCPTPRQDGPPFNVRKPLRS